MAQCDVAVVGGSLAGSFLAHLLGAEGFKVKLFEPVEFPRRKPCGEGLSVLALPYLRAAGLWSPELQQAALPFYGYDIWLKSGRRCRLNGKGEIPELYSIPRSVLDDSVQKAALANKNVQLCREAVSSFSPKDTKWCITTDEGRYDSRQLVLAAGGIGRSLLNLPSAAREKTARRYGFVAWIKGSWRQSPPRLIPIVQSDGYELVLTPERDGVLNISVLISSTESSVRREREWYLARALEISKTLGFSAESQIELRGVPEISASRLSHVPNLIFPIGDLIERFDPIGGMGMTHAVFSAAEAARAISHALHGRVPTSLAWQNYLERRERGARYLRMSSWMSFSLNVARIPLLQSLVHRAPKLSYQAQRFIKGGFGTKVSCCLEE